MKRNGFIGALTVFLTACLTVAAFAGPWGGWRGSSGWGTGSSYQRIYNPATVETVNGEVVTVERTAPMKGMGAGIHLQLKTDKETLPVHLGPSWYIERLDAGFQKGDAVEVKGSRVSIGGKPAIIAAEVKKGDASLKLRDDSGIPAWAGWRK